MKDILVLDWKTVEGGASRVDEKCGSLFFTTRDGSRVAIVFNTKETWHLLKMVIKILWHHYFPTR